MNDCFTSNAHTPITFTKSVTVSALWIEIFLSLSIRSTKFVICGLLYVCMLYVLISRTGIWIWYYYAVERTAIIIKNQIETVSIVNGLVTHTPSLPCEVWCWVIMENHSPFLGIFVTIGLRSSQCNSSINFGIVLNKTLHPH